MHNFKTHFDALVASFKNPKSRRKLHALDDRVLKDIGLRRVDLLMPGTIERRQR